MGTRTGYASGLFCWVELATTDPDAAKGFYADLLGWSYEDLPVEGGVYTMATLDGSRVAALMGRPPGDESPPHWNNYIAVANADETAAKAAGAGGSVVMEPFDVMAAGRMAVMQDPTGAFVCIWQPGETAGAEMVNEIGALTWNDLATPDVEAASAFYAGVFGWAAEAMDTGDAPAYLVVSVDGRSNGGIREQGPEEAEHVPPHWLPYFAVESVDESVAKATAAGGRVLLEPMDLPNGARLAQLADPQRAAFAISESEMDD